MRNSILALLILLIAGCSQHKIEKERAIIGFLDFIEDPTIALAKKGFFDALSANGFSEKDSTITIEYANAQGDIPTLGQACDLIISKHPTLIGTNVTLSTITTVQRNKTIPVFMMVSPRPDIAKLTDASGKSPSNLFGVYETLDYLDTAITLIKQLRPLANTVGTIYNQSEPQSVDAFKKLKSGCEKLGMKLEVLPVNNSSETQLVMQSLLNKNIDVFFALPDNVIFASFESVVRSCDEKSIPIFTSEAGLVKRGAVASFGADFYQWGYQSGLQAALYLKQKNANGLQPEIIQIRKRVYNARQAAKFSIIPDSTFTPIEKIP